MPLLSLLALLTGAFPVGAQAENPFLAAANDQPVAAKFQGTEWRDDIGPKDLPLSARLVTTRIAAAPWGAIFKITFEDIHSRAKPKREIAPIYYVATDNEIALLNVEKPEEAAAELVKQPNPPAFDPGDIDAISEGTRVIPNGQISSATIAVKGARCTYEWTHNSGHFRTVIWQKGVGLIEYAQGQGARKDGYRLIREGSTVGSKPKRKK